LIEAFFWGLIAASPLVLGSLAALRHPPSRRALGLITAFGAGALISAVAYELVLEATTTSSDQLAVVFGFAAGVLAFFGADWVISNKGAQEGASASTTSARGVVLGSILDGVPESIALGISVAGSGGVSTALLVSVVLSNFPEGVMATNGLAAGGYSGGRVVTTWCFIALLSGIAAMIGYAFADAAPEVVAFMLAFAGGAVITMVADSMLPEAYKDSGLLTGPSVALGFAVAFAVHALD
jgi:ZIP family zinc transporter